MKKYKAARKVPAGNKIRCDFHNSSMNKKQRLFVDMDGVLAGFKKTASQNNLYEKNYFRNLPPQENVVEAIRQIILQDSNNIDVYILTSVLQNHLYAIAEKRAWLSEFLPEVELDRMICVPHSEIKTGYVPGGVRLDDVLLDDYTVNLLAWEKFGTGIKLLNDINHTNGTWQGEFVHRQSHPMMIKTEIEIIMDMARTQRIMRDNLTAMTESNIA